MKRASLVVVKTAVSHGAKDIDEREYCGEVMGEFVMYRFQ